MHKKKHRHKRSTSHKRKYICVDSYARRDSLLLGMGYKNYSEYLASELWRSIRIRVFAKYGCACKVCTYPAMCVHHLSYSLSVLLGRSLHKLVPLCYNCHNLIEFTPTGRKRTLAKANSAYFRMRKSNAS